jgi:hypothetical protein
MTRLKAAWIRDEGYPVGKPAPGHFICNCAERLPATEDGATCGKCGTHFDANGWVVE